MTATSGIGVPSLSSDSKHMSTSPSSSRFSERRRTARARQVVLQARARTPVEAWSRIVIVLFTFMNLFLSSAHSQTILDQYTQNRTALNRQIYTAAFSYINSINASLKTGVIYNVSLPGNINDNSVKLESIQVVRLRRGSLNRHGIPFNEITLPIGVQVIQTPVHVVLVYRKFSQYGYYDTTNSTVFLAPVVGILAYDYLDMSNYTISYGPELSIVASAEQPIEVQQQPSRSLSPDQLSCVFYTNNVNSTATGVISNVTSSDACSWSTIGDFSLLGPPHHKKSETWKIVVGSVVGGLAAIILLAVLTILAFWWRERRHFSSMEQKSDQGESLHHTWFGNSRAPAAASTRTKPVLESENV